MSLHLEGKVRMRESLLAHSVSHLVSMVSYMYVTVSTTEFRYASFVLSTLFTIMITTSSVMIMIICIPVQLHVYISRKEFHFRNGWPYVLYDTALQLL